MKRGGTFLLHGLVDQQAEAFGEAGRTLVREELQNGIEKIRFGQVGNV